VRAVQSITPLDGLRSALASRESWVEVFRQALNQRDQKLGEVLADPTEGKPKLNVADHFDLRVRRHRLYLAAQKFRAVRKPFSLPLFTHYLSWTLSYLERHLPYRIVVDDPSYWMHDLMFVSV